MPFWLIEKGRKNTNRPQKTETQLNTICKSHTQFPNIILKWAKLKNPSTVCWKMQHKLHSHCNYSWNSKPKAPVCLCVCVCACVCMRVHARVYTCVCGWSQTNDRPMSRWVQTPSNRNKPHAQKCTHAHTHTRSGTNNRYYDISSPLVTWCIIDTLWVSMFFLFKVQTLSPESFPDHDSVLTLTLKSSLNSSVKKWGPALLSKSILTLKGKRLKLVLTKIEVKGAHTHRVVPKLNWQRRSHMAKGELGAGQRTVWTE